MTALCCKACSNARYAAVQALPAYEDLNKHSHLHNHLHNQQLGAWFLAAQVHASFLLCGRTLDCQEARQPFQTPDSEQRAKRIGLPWDNHEKQNHCGGCRTHASYLSDHILATHLT